MNFQICVIYDWEDILSRLYSLRSYIIISIFNDNLTLDRYPVFVEKERQNNIIHKHEGRLKRSKQVFRFVVHHTPLPAQKLGQKSETVFLVL